MRAVSSLLLAGALASASPRAEACGGCFTSPAETTQVTGHRMLFSVSPEQTTLWDEIVYAGEPESFAWVLPIRGSVDIGLSSDALFAEIDARTRVQIRSPCWMDTSKGNYDYAPDNESMESEGVEVLAHEVVGPYETVQLASDDATALEAWLASHGYAIPADVAPVIGAYVAEDFDFLALKLVPGEGVAAMRPVRVTSAGADVRLPLRMIAAGTGPIAPITLWVFGEGRWEPANFPATTIDPADIVWDYATQSSNYGELKNSLFYQTDGRGWTVERAAPFSRYELKTALCSASGSQAPGWYPDDDGDAVMECKHDIETLFHDIDAASLWVTRLSAELSRAALGSDLELSAAADQRPVSGELQATKSIGEPTCSGSSGIGGTRRDGAEPDHPDWVAGGGCAVRRSGAGSGLGILGAWLLIGALSRGRRRLLLANCRGEERR